MPYIPVAVVNQNAVAPCFGLDEYVEQVMLDTPVAYWKMDETSGLPQDSSGNGNHMTAVSGTPVYSQPGPLSDTSIEYPSAAFHERAVVSTLTTNFTVEMWSFRTGNASGDFYRHGTTSGGFEMEYTTTAGVWRPNLPGVGTLGTVDVTFDPDVWWHIVLQRATTTWTAYMNGVWVDQPGTGTPGTPVGNDRVVGGGATGQRFAHVAFYDALLSPDRIAQHYFSGVGFA